MQCKESESAGDFRCGYNLLLQVAEGSVSTSREVKFRFVIRNQDPAATPAEIRKRVKKATQKALELAQAANPSTEASTQLEGGIFGIGETAIILAIVHAAKAGAAAAALGAAGEAGKEFYKGYLAPQLRKLNLLPFRLKAISSDAAPSQPAKKAVSKPVKQKRAAKKSSK